MMTEKEREVLRLLEKDARTTPEQLATMTNLSPEEVTRIIRQAEAQRLVLKYKTIINWEKAGEEQVWALIEVKVAPQRDVGFDAAAERIYRFPQARSVCQLLGHL